MVVRAGFLVGHLRSVKRSDGGLGLSLSLVSCVFLYFRSVLFCLHICLGSLLMGREKVGFFFFRDVGSLWMFIHYFYFLVPL